MSRKSSIPQDTKSVSVALMPDIELAGDKLAIPARDGVGSGYGSDLRESLAAEPMTDLAERSSLGVRELNRPFSWGLEDAVLDGQIFVPKNCTGPPPHRYANPAWAFGFRPF
jgi:hypothetical protein